jgi:hypothetical protein
VADEDIVVEDMACSDRMCAARISSSHELDREYRQSSDFSSAWRNANPNRISGFVRSTSESSDRYAYTIFQMLDDEVNAISP